MIAPEEKPATATRVESNANFGKAGRVSLWHPASKVKPMATIASFGIDGRAVLQIIPGSNGRIRGDIFNQAGRIRGGFLKKCWPLQRRHVGKKRAASAATC